MQDNCILKETSAMQLNHLSMSSLFQQRQPALQDVFLQQVQVAQHLNTEVQQSRVNFPVLPQ